MKTLVVIPHYNHSRTLRGVAEQCLRQTPDVAVFDDGSDESPSAVLDGLPLSFVRFEKNRGKGAVILEAACWAQTRGFTHILTIDADGQHNPDEIPVLLRAAGETPRAVIIGKRRFSKDEVPFSSRFGRKFGGFWVHLQTGKAVSDIQSGFRCYPVDSLLCLPCLSRRYAFEVEIIVRALWAGFPVRETEVSVTYPKNRVSHFGAFKDNLRLSLLNTHLTVRAMLPVPHRRYYTDEKTGENVKRGYWQALLDDLKKPGSAVRNAVSAAWGIFCGSIALPGIRQIMLFMGAGWWNLNKLLSISFEKLCIGPFVPAFCIEAGYFLRYGRFLTEFNLTTLGRQFWQRVWEWVLGSLFIAPLLAGITFLIVWTIGIGLHRGLRERV